MLTDPKTVLLLGPSNLTFSETGPSQAIPALVQSELEAMAPQDSWRCEHRPLMYGRRMAEIAERHTRSAQPAAVVIGLVQNPFAFDVPIAVIRRRWPWFYPFARWGAERLKALGGGADVPSPAGWPYRFSRWLVARVIGAEPEVDVEDAIRDTVAALDGLVRMEDIAVVCGFFMRPVLASGTTRQTYEQRTGAFRARIREHCRQRHIDLFDRNEALETAGRDYSMSSNDREYSDLPTRQFAAAVIARHVAAAVARNPIGPEPRPA